MINQARKDSIDAPFMLPANGLYLLPYLAARHNLEELKSLLGYAVPGLAYDDPAIIWAGDNAIRLLRKYMCFDNNDKLNAITIAFIASDSFQSQSKKHDSIRYMLDLGFQKFNSDFKKTIGFLINSINNNNTYTEDLKKLPNSIELLKPSEAMDYVIKVIKSYTSMSEELKEIGSRYRFLSNYLDWLKVSVNYNYLPLFHALCNPNIVDIYNAKNDVHFNDIIEDLHSFTDNEQIRSSLARFNAVNNPVVIEIGD